MDTIKNKKGFTLIEVLVVIVVLGIVGSIGATILHHSYELAYANRDALETTWQNKIALRRIASEIREIRSRNDLLTMNSNAIRFVNTNGNTIQYSLSGNYLQRTINASVSENLANGISSLTFLYYKQDNTTTTNPADATLVRCISVEIPDLHTLICPRNLL